MSEVKRDVVLGLLKKLGANFTEDISDERAVKKLKRYVEKEGLPDEYTKEEADVLVALELAEVDAPAPEPTKGKGKAKAKVSKGKKTPAKEKPAKGKAKTKTPPKPKGEHADWMVASGKALRKNKNIAEASKLALETYLGAGGRKVANVKSNAKLSVSRAVRALVGFGVVELSEDGEKIRSK